MSYEPLHHKYRPKSFAELVGQEAIATTLTNAICTTKIAPAYLFTGPRGTGKTSSARILAKSLNCLKYDKPTPQPCGVCDVCKGITKGYSLDVIEIDAASNTGVDNVRDLIEKAQFAPVQCRYKVYVVDECHMLSTQAFNALLKTLEEPPKHVVFVLATTDPQRVLPTIISRCQRFDFRRIPLEAMVRHLSAIASTENIHISPDAITLIAQIAQGGLRDAESLLDQLSLLSGEVTPDQFWDLVGSVSEQDLFTLLIAIASNNPEDVLDCTRKILDRGREPLTILQNLAAFYRDLLIAKTAPNRNDLVACTHHTWKELVNFAQNLDTSTILVGQQQLRTAEAQLKNTTQPRLWLEITLLGLLPSANITTKADPPKSVIFASPQVLPPHNPGENKSVPSRETPIVPKDIVYKDTVVEKEDKLLTEQEKFPLSSPPSISSPPISSNSQTHANSITVSALTSPPSPPSPSTQETNEEGDSSSQMDQIWQQVVESLLQPASRALFKEHGRLLSINDGVAQVGMPPKLVKLAQGKKVADVEAAFAKVYQQKVKVSFVSNQSQTVPANETREVPKNITSPTHQTFTPTNQNNVVPTSEVAKPKVAPVKQEPLPKTTTVPQTPPTEHWETDEATIAAQRLAQFFDGAVVSFTDDTGLPNSLHTSEWEEEGEMD